MKAALTLLAALFSLTGARAETLTVYTQSNNATNQYVPVYTSGFSSTYFLNTTYYLTNSQFIIPATTTGMSDMIGCDITAIKFYTNNRNYTSPGVYVYVKEVDNTTFDSSDLVTEGTTTVYSGYLHFTNSELAISFNTPYTYNGGNLLIGVKNEGTGRAPSQNQAISFKGQNQGSSYTACYGRSSSGAPTSGTRVSFIPQTTFTYSKPGPRNVTASNISYNSAKINWEGNANASSYNLRCRELEFYDEFHNLNNWTIVTKGETVSGYEEGWFWYGDQVVAYSWYAYSQNGETITEDIDADNWLISPAVEMGGTLEFDVLTNAGYPDSYEVLFSTGNTYEDFTAASAVTLRSLAEATTGTVSIDLSTHAGERGYIAIHHKCESCFYLDIDNFRIYKGTEITQNGITAPPYKLEGLNSETSYEVQVQTVYGESKSLWAGTFFTTTDENPIPTEVDVEPEIQSATISWFGVSEWYEVNYRKAAAANSIDFEDNSLGDWTPIDADGDGNGWEVSSSSHGGSYAVSSASWTSTGALTPDNWLVSPKVTLGGCISFWAKGRDPNWPYEVFGVGVATKDNPNPSDFTMVGAKTVATGEWTQYVFDLSAYSGEGYVAIRHYDCTDMFILDIDDIVIHQGGEWTTVKTTAPSELSVELTGLIPNTDYEFTIIGFKDDEPNAGTPYAIFTTLPATAISIENYADNTELIEAVDGQTLDVTLKNRKFYKDGTWNTLCLPFDVPDVAGTELEDAEIYTLARAELVGSTLELEFMDVSKIAAGTPFIVRWPAGREVVSDPVFYGVTISNISTNMVVDYTTDETAIYFKGTYGYTEFEESNNHILFMGSNNTLYYPNAGAKIGACRAYFELEGIKAIDPAPAPTKFHMSFVDDPTGVKSINIDLNQNETIYNLAGQRLGKMQQGINIVNGKKIMVK